MQDTKAASRRRFTKAGLAAPILMTLASRPVLGQGRFCTASAFASANPSRPVDLSTCTGCSPGYWHHENACWYQTGLSRTDTFAAAFGYQTMTSTGFTKKERQVLNLQLQEFFPGPNWWDYKFVGAQLKLYRMCRAAAALTLSINHPAVPIPISVYDVIDRLDAALALDGSRRDETQYDIHKAYFETFYNQDGSGCPLPNNGNCPS